MNTETIYEVGLQILDLEHPTFSELVKVLDGRISRNKISIALDNLNDMGMIEETWINRNGSYRREISLTGEGSELFEDMMTKVVKNDQN